MRATPERLAPQCPGGNDVVDRAELNVPEVRGENLAQVVERLEELEVVVSRLAQALGPDEGGAWGKRRADLLQ
jgi:hypothetical protein